MARREKGSGSWDTVTKNDITYYRYCKKYVGMASRKEFVGRTKVQGRTILMVTHDPNAASFCSRILFIQDGVIFHELRRKVPTETREEFYARILQVMAQMGGGSANVL